MELIHFKIWALDCLKRDGFKCVDCGSDSGSRNLLVHHIDESRKTGKLNNHQDNLVTLCKQCHAKRHGFVKIRHDIVEMIDAGRSFREVGELLGISHQRVHFLYKKAVTWYESNFTRLDK